MPSNKGQGSLQQALKKDTSRRPFEKPFKKDWSCCFFNPDGTAPLEARSGEAFVQSGRSLPANEFGRHFSSSSYYVVSSFSSSSSSSPSSFSKYIPSEYLQNTFRIPSEYLQNTFKIPSEYLLLQPAENSSHLQHTELILSFCQGRLRGSYPFLRRF